MPRASSLGLQVLERDLGPPRRWRWWLGIALVLALAAGLMALVLRSPDLAASPLFDGLRQRGALEAALAGFAAAAAGLAMIAVLAVRRTAGVGGTAARQRAVLDSIIANVPEAVLVADALGNYRANAAAVRLFGLPRESGTAGEYHDAMVRLDRRNPETGNRIPPGAGVLEAALAGKPMAQDQVIQSPEGARTIHLAGSPIPMAHGLRGGLVLASDVTERLAMLAALKAAKEGLERKNAEHLQMARTIAHDLGNALTPAEMHLKIMELSKGNPEKVGRSLPVLERSVAQMHRLIGDLSDMARLESGQMKVQVQRVPLRPAVAAAVASYAPVAQEKSVQLVDAAPGNPTVLADPERLGQVLSNLLSNAVKFTPAGGTVTLTSQELDGFVQVAVADTGFGLSQAQITRLFQPFSQVHDPGSVKERGTGLGLFICKGLVERQGGAMGVASAGPGKGSTFWFTLPLAQA